MLIQNTPCHPTVSVSRPPATGPTAVLSPNTDPHTPTARARSRGSVITLTTIARATGESIEAPTPWTARAVTSIPAVGARAQARDAAAKMTSPVQNTRRRPNRSARAPEVISSPAKGTV